MPWRSAASDKTKETENPKPRVKASYRRADKRDEPDKERQQCDAGNYVHVVSSGHVGSLTSLYSFNLAFNSLISAS